MNDTTLLGLLCSTFLIGFMGGWIIGFMMGVFKFEDRESSKRYPRPGTEPTRPERFKPYRRHPDMLKPDNDESKNP